MSFTAEERTDVRDLLETMYDLVMDEFTDVEDLGFMYEPFIAWVRATATLLEGYTDPSRNDPGPFIDSTVLHALAIRVKERFSADQNQ